MFTRRDFLKMGGLMVSAGATIPAFLSRTLEVAEAASSGKILVVVQLAGGNDGLNTVIPYNDSLYKELRPSIGRLKKEESLALDDNLALHSEMAALKARYDAGQVAIVQNVGYPNPNRSHFRATEIWHTAIPEQYEPSGWLGRYLDNSCCGTSSPARASTTQAFSVTDSLPLTFWTSHVLVPTIGSVNAFQFQTDGEYPDDRQNQLDAIGRLYAKQSSPREYDEFVRTIGSTALDTSEQIQKIAKTYTPKATYANDGLANSLKTVAQLMQADFGTRIYYVSIGGFDTHSRQAATQATLLRQVSNGIDSFLKDLEAQGKADNVLVMTFSEFGRRARQNASEGTDHGTAAPLFVIGQNVRGGIHGSPPDLKNLVDGDLKYEIDFRSVYGTILDTWMGAPSDKVLGAKYAPVPFLA